MRSNYQINQIKKKENKRFKKIEDGLKYKYVRTVKWNVWLIYLLVFFSDPSANLYDEIDNFSRYCILEYL